MSVPCPLHWAPVTVFTPSWFEIVRRRQTDSLCLAEGLTFARTGFGAVTYRWCLSRLGRGGCRSLHLGKLSIVLLLIQMRVLAWFAFLFERASTIL